MRFLLKLTIFLLINTVIVFAIFGSELTLKKTTEYIRPAFKSRDYKYWTKLSGKEFCTTGSEMVSKLISEMTKIAATKANVVYLSDVDLVSCKDNFAAIAEISQEFNLLLATNLEINPDSKLYFNADGNLNTEYFNNKFKDYKDTTQWLSYIVFDNAMDRLTFEERKIIRVTLRDLFPKSFLGFRFNPTFGPTPENTNPNRTEKPWQDFLPHEDDGDFIITNLQVQGFKRTLVFAEDRKVLNDSCNGEFL